MSSPKIIFVKKLLERFSRPSKDMKNFPHWTTLEDISAVVEETNQEAQRVRILTHDAQV